MIYNMRTANQAYQDTMFNLGISDDDIKDEIAFLVDVAVRKGNFYINYKRALSTAVMDWLLNQNSYSVQLESANPTSFNYKISWEYAGINDKNNGAYIFSEMELQNMAENDIVELALSREYDLPGIDKNKLITLFLKRQEIENKIDGEYSLKNLYNALSKKAIYPIPAQYQHDFIDMFLTDQEVDMAAWQTEHPIVEGEDPQNYPYKPYTESELSFRSIADMIEDMKIRGYQYSLEKYKDIIIKSYLENLELIEGT